MTDHKQKICGYPLTVGLKKKIAKKHIHRWWNKQDLAELAPLIKTKVGDLVSECSGLNSRIVSMIPCYLRIGNGGVLVDVDVTTDKTSCSLMSCGVGPAKTKDEMEAYRRGLLAQYSEDDAWGFAKRYSYENLTINDDGTYEMKDRA